LVPEDYKFKKVNHENKVTIQLISFAIGNNSISEYKQINEYRNFLTPFSERLVERELNRMFKETFHNFVSGYVSSTNNSIGSQKEGIELFCKVYRLGLNEINYEMLKKSWDRSEQKKRINNMFLNHCISA
jgi:hypothetical protein